MCVDVWMDVGGIEADLVVYLINHFEADRVVFFWNVPGARAGRYFFLINCRLVRIIGIPVVPVV